MYISGEFGRQWLGTSDAFYGTAVATAFGGPFPGGIPEPSYNTWNIGIGFTYKVFTLDLRYSDTDLSKGNCNAFTSDFSSTTAGTGLRDRHQPGQRHDGVRLQLVQRDRYRQALGRPDGDDQPEVRFQVTDPERAAERSAALFIWAMRPAQLPAGGGHLVSTWWGSVVFAIAGSPAWAAAAAAGPARASRSH